MFGFITPNFQTLSDEENSRYQSVYCGLCHSLRDNYSNVSRLALSYDLTFLVLLLSSLYEPDEEKENCNCIFHPGDKYETAQNKFSDYCADLTVALAYHKILDDINDEDKLIAKVGERALASQYKKVKEKLPDTCALIEKSMAEIQKIECGPRGNRVNATGKSSVGPGELFGYMLGCLFDVKHDNWSETLVKLGANLGRLIYYMDAAVDFEDDVKNDSFNPFKESIKVDKIDEATAHDIKDKLTVLAGQATAHFEKLPLEQDINLLNNILYEGL